MPARYQRLTELDGQANDPSRLGSRIRRSRGGWFMRHLEALARRPSRMITLAIGAFLIIFLTTWLGFTRSGHDAARDWVSSASEQAGSWISGAAKLDKGGENGAQSATNTKAGPTTPGLNPWTIGGPPKPVYEKVKGGEISPAEAVFDFTPGAPPVTVEEMAQWGSKADNGLLYPPNFIPALSNKSPRAKAGFIVLVRNAELHSMQESMREVESRFNSKYGYPWIFLNDADFTDEFKAGVRKFTRSETRFGKVPVEHWSYPPWINQTKAAEARKNMKGILYGSSETYRHMCRFQTGFFYRHPLTQDLDYYWRVEPGIKLHCHLDYDPFLFMQMNNKTYGFTMALHEYLGTVPTLWQEARDFIEKHPQFLAKDHGLHFMTDEPDKLMEPGWNLCHFWDNFELVDLRFFRSEAYMKFFEHLDHAGGFFYERWGDAPIHSIAAILLLDRSRIHFFDDIGYRHEPFEHCPQADQYHNNGKCSCNPMVSFDRHPYGCLKEWFRTSKEGFPPGYEFLK